MPTREELRQQRERGFRGYLRTHPDEAQALVAESILREAPYSDAGTPDVYMNIVDRHDHFLHALDIPHTDIGSRADIERLTLEALGKCQKGDIYWVKGGDVDFFLEEINVWNQVGGENVIEVYGEARGRGVEIEVVGSADPFRKHRDGKKIVDLLNQLGVPLKVIDDPLRAVYVRRADESEAFVWYSMTQASTPFKSHDPELSLYKGYGISSKTPQCVPFINSAERALRELQGRAAPAQRIIEEIEERERVNGRKPNGSEGGGK